MDALETEGQIAGVLGHEIVYVIARHGAERIAEAQLAEGLTGALVLATYDPENTGSMHTSQVAILIGQLIQMKYGREDEIQADTHGVRIMAESGYDPRVMVYVMRVLESAGGGPAVEFFSKHPSPDNRVARIQQAIDDVYPGGVPDGMLQ